MFGTIKKAMVAAAVVGITAVAPAVASADQWTVGGAPFAGTARAHGTLTLTAAGTQTTCTVTATLSLNNGGTAPNQARGSVTSFLLGAPAGGTCTTTVPNCTVTAVATSLPWNIATTGTNVTIGPVSFTNTYSGVGCSLAGVPVSATGSITGAAAANVLTFTNAGPLTTTLGSATVDGSVTVTNTSGAAVSLS
ncbi:MAG: hypothetical protein WC558_07965 [Patulibacter sp.]